MSQSPNWDINPTIRATDELIRQSDVEAKYNPTTVLLFYTGKIL